VSKLLIYLTLFLLTPFTVCSQDTNGAFLSDDELRKVLLIAHELDSLSETLELTEMMYDNAEARVNQLDSQMVSYVVIMERQDEIREANDLMIEQLNQSLKESQRKLQLRTQILKIGIPVSIGLGFVGGLVLLR